MSYIENRKTHNKTTTFIAVTLIEGLVIFGIVNGLAVTFSPPIPEPKPTATHIPFSPPPPLPPNKPKADNPEKQRPDTVTTAENPLAPATDELAPQPMPTPLPGDFVIIEPEPSPSPVPLPSFTPRGVKVLGKPATWATPDDYPGHDLRAGNQGVSHFRLTIGPDGRVQRCSIVHSSGFPGLDAATCNKVTARARFEPATDESGMKVASTYTNRIHWKIPE